MQEVGSSNVVVLLLVFACAQQPFSLLQQQREAIAQQQPEQVTRQKVPLGAVADSNFTNYTNPQYGFSLLYPPSWVNKEIDPGANLTQCHLDDTGNNRVEVFVAEAASANSPAVPTVQTTKK